MQAGWKKAQQRCHRSCVCAEPLICQGLDPTEPSSARVMGSLPDMPSCGAYSPCPRACHPVHWARAAWYAADILHWAACPRGCRRWTMMAKSTYPTQCVSWTAFSPMGRNCSIRIRWRESITPLALA